ncbi:hypothetical protein CRYUN_Cryun04dG0038400 [Craigia yunnanensis]
MRIWLGLILVWLVVTDTEILESNWTSFKDVLLEIIDDQPESLDSSATGSDGFAGGTEIKIVPSIEEAEAANYLGRTVTIFLSFQLMETLKQTPMIFQSKGGLVFCHNFFQEDSTETFLGDPFLSTYNEDERKGAAIDLGLQLSLSADETNSSTVDIFRVWDLNIPAEENDLIKQLNKATAETETSFQSMPSAFNDSTAWKDLKDEPLDNLTAGIADLSLNTKSFS